VGLRVFTWLRKLYRSVDEFLTAWYRLCERTDWHRPETRSGVHSLALDEVMRFPPETRVRCIEVIRGTVGLTGIPAEGDLLIRAGERFQLIGDRPFVMKAVAGEAEIKLLP
jgi:hypothetical protein